MSSATNQRSVGPSESVVTDPRSGATELYEKLSDPSGTTSPFWPKRGSSARAGAPAAEARTTMAARARMPSAGVGLHRRLVDRFLVLDLHIVSLLAHVIELAPRSAVDLRARSSGLVEHGLRAEGDQREPQDEDYDLAHAPSIASAGRNGQGGCVSGFLLLPAISAGSTALLRQRFLAGEADLPAPVDGDDLDQHLVAFLEHVFDLLHPRTGEIGDVHETVGAGEDLHEGAELHDPPHGAEIRLPHLRLLRQRADHLDRLIDALARRRGVGDAAVVLDVDARAGAGDDVLDHLAAGPDDVLDAGHGDADGGDLRRVLGDVGARHGNRLGHLGEDVEPAAAGLLESIGEDLPI